MSAHVSVIIPTLGRDPYLKQCILSLFSQSKKPDEILIIDNTPDKKAGKIFGRLKNKSVVPLRYYAEPLTGASYARNTGIARAKFATLAFIDDDCTADKDWLRELLRVHAVSKGKTFVQGASKNGLPENFFASLQYFKEELFLRSGFLNKKAGVLTPWFDSKNFLVNKSVLMSHRMRFNNFAIFQDLDMTLQMITKKIAVTPAPKAVVWHCGISSLPQGLRKWILLGIDRYYLHKTWLAKGLLFSKNQETTHTDTTEQTLTRQALKDKPFLYKTAFHFWYRFSVAVTETSFFFMKLLHPLV